MTKIIAFANQKGGVAKTTSAVALSQILSMDDKRVLFLDLDPQENASNTLCLDPDIPSLYDFMTAEEDDRATLNKCFQQVKSCPNITAIRGAIRLSAADMRLNMQGREFILRERLAPYLDNYDVVSIDTPPSLGILTINALTCANTVVVPVSPDGYSLQGFHQLTESIRTIKRYSNPQLKTGGILITLYVPNTNVSKAINRCESFKVETEEKFKKVREDRDRQTELNSAYDERIKQAEETIAALTQVIMPREKGRHEARSEEGGKV